MEGDDVVLTVTLTNGFDVQAEVSVDADDPNGALTGAVDPLEFPIGETGITAVFATDDNETNDGSRTVTFTLTAPDGSDGYTVGDPSAVTVTVLDDDAPPTAPRNLRAEARVDGVWLTWDPPDSSGDAPVDAYAYRVSKDGGDTWGSLKVLAGADGSTRSQGVQIKVYQELTIELAASSAATDGYGAWSNSATATPFHPGALRWRLRASTNTERRLVGPHFAATLIEGDTLTADAEHCRGRALPEGPVHYA